MARLGLPFVLRAECKPSHRCSLIMGQAYTTVCQVTHSTAGNRHRVCSFSHSTVWRVSSFCPAPAVHSLEASSECNAPSALMRGLLLFIFPKKTIYTQIAMMLTSRVWAIRSCPIVLENVRDPSFRHARCAGEFIILTVLPINVDDMPSTIFNTAIIAADLTKVMPNASDAASTQNLPHALLLNTAIVAVNLTVAIQNASDATINVQLPQLKLYTAQINPIQSRMWPSTEILQIFASCWQLRIWCTANTALRPGFAKDRQMPYRLGTSGAPNGAQIASRIEVPLLLHPMQSNLV